MTETERDFTEQRAAEKAADRGRTQTLEKVVETDGGWEVTMDGSLCWHIQRKYVDAAGIEAPKVGDTLVCYPGGFGMMIHGADLNGVELFYTCEEERELERQEYIRKREAEKHAKFEENREKLDQWYDEFPPEFKERIDIRRRNNPDFRWEYESFEMWACRAAIQLAEWAQKQVATDSKLLREVDAFWDDDEKLLLAGYPRGEAWVKPDNRALQVLFWWMALNGKAFDYDYKRQLNLVKHIELPDSGNSFGFTCHMASIWIRSPADVPKPPGVMSPLVGSVAYGDCTQEEMDAQEAVPV